MRHWFCALRARLTSRSDLSLFERTSANVRMNTTCSAAASRARVFASTAAARGSVSISSGNGRSFAGDYISSYSYVNRLMDHPPSRTAKERSIPDIQSAVRSGRES